MMLFHPFHESILILPRLMFVESYVKSSTFHICGRIHDIFPHFLFGSIYILPLNISRGLYIVLNLPHCGRLNNTFYITFLLKYIFLTRLKFVQDYVKSRKNNYVFPHFYFVKVYLFFHV